MSEEARTGAPPYVAISLFGCVAGLATGSVVAGILGAHDVIPGGMLVIAGALAVGFGSELAHAQEALALSRWFPAGLVQGAANNRYMGAILLWFGLTWTFG